LLFIISHGDSGFVSFVYSFWAILDGSKLDTNAFHTHTNLENIIVLYTSPFFFLFRLHDHFIQYAFRILVSDNPDWISQDTFLLSHLIDVNFTITSLDPLLFLIYINYILASLLKGKFLMYADDMTLVNYEKNWNKLSKLIYDKSMMEWKISVIINKSAYTPIIIIR
jgi:hypothetical protein